MTFALITSTALAVSAQRPITEIRATGEHTLTGVTPASARQLALADATLKALQESATQLRNLPEVQGLQLKPAQLEAYAAALLDPKEQSVRSAATGQIYRADVILRIDPNGLARRTRLLRPRMRHGR